MFLPKVVILWQMKRNNQEAAVTHCKPCKQ